MSLHMYILLYVCLLKKQYCCYASNPLGVMISARPMRHVHKNTHKQMLHMNAGQIKEGETGIYLRLEKHRESRIGALFFFSFF